MLFLILIIERRGNLVNCLQETRFCDKTAIKNFQRTEGSLEVKCFRLLIEIVADQHLQQLVTVNLADQTACIVVIGDISRIL